PFLHLGDPDDPRDPTRRAYTAPPLRALLRSADCVFAQTESERAELRHLGVAEKRIVLQGLGVDPAECSGGDRIAARARWNVRAGEVVVGHLANNSEEKGSVDLLRAAVLLWQRGAPLRLVLAGPEMPNFQRAWRLFASAAHSVCRLGVLDDQQKRDFFAAIDVFALPSRSDSFGLVLLEAWANGAPCVGYRAGGLPWVIRDGVDGLIVRCGDLDGVGAALRRVEEDGEVRCWFGGA